MRRELDLAKEKISALSSQVDDLRQQDGKAKNECDVGIHNHALLVSEVNSLSHDADEYSRIPEEDMESLSNALNEERRQKFAAEQRRSTAMSTIHEIEQIISDLNQGIPSMPTKIRDTPPPLSATLIHCPFSSDHLVK